jgi:hypothetical protein
MQNRESPQSESFAHESQLHVRSRILHPENASGNMKLLCPIPGRLIATLRNRDWRSIVTLFVQELLDFER